MKYKIRRLLFVGIWIGGVAGAIFSWTKLPGLLEEITYKEGLRTLDNEPISTLDQAAQGRPILIEVQYHAGCPYCIEEIEYLKKLDLPPEVVMVMLNNVSDSRSKVEKFVSEHDIPDHWMIAIGGSLMSNGTPYTRIFVMTEKGWQVVEEKVGWDGGQMFASLAAALKEGEE